MIAQNLQAALIPANISPGTWYESRQGQPNFGPPMAFYSRAPRRLGLLVGNAHIPNLPEQLKDET